MSPKTVIYIISGVFFLAFVVIFLLIRKRTINEKEKNLLIVIQTVCGILSLFLAALNIIIQIIQSKPVIIYSPTEGSQTTNGFSEQALEVPSQRQTPTPMAKLTNNSTSKSTPFSVTIGSTVYFGHYEQDDNTANGKESIEWIVLAKEGSKALLISKYALDCQPYNTIKTGVTWETCSMRKWLNGSFLSSAFSESEQDLIISATITADANPFFITEPGNNTKDKIFLLSIKEVIEYLDNYEARKCAPTNYAITQGAATSNEFYKDGKAACWWWLRSPGYDSIVAARVDCDGSVFSEGRNVNHNVVAVRPAMWINSGS